MDFIFGYTYVGYSNVAQKIFVLSYCFFVGHTIYNGGDYV